MSSEALLWAARQRTGSVGARAVLYALADICHHGTGWTAWPAVATLADHAELDRKTVIAALAHLARLGLIADTGCREGRTRQVVVWAIAPQSVPETGRLPAGAAAKRPGNGTLSPAEPAPAAAKSTVFPTEESRKRDTNLLKEPKKEARGHAGARDPVDNLAAATASQKKERLGEGFAGLPPSPPGSDPPPVMVRAAFEEWDAMERRFGLPGPVRRTTAREAALVRMLRARGSAAVATVVAAAGFDHDRPRRPHQRRPGQTDWLTMFDQLFEAAPEYRDGMRAFDRLLALPAALLAGDPPDDPAAGDAPDAPISANLVPAGP